MKEGGTEGVGTCVSVNNIICNILVPSACNADMEGLSLESHAHAGKYTHDVEL